MTIQVHGNKDILEFDEKKLELVKNTICKDATNEEFEVFVDICKSTQLNPLFKQIYFIKRGGKPSHQTSIDGLRLIADRTKRYIPGREPTFFYDKQGNLVSATSYVKKLASDGTWHEVAATAMFKEYNANINLWKTMPHVMIAKCAEAQALRKAFPADMLGLYTKDEMDQSEYTAYETHKPHTEERREETTIQAEEEPISDAEARDLATLLSCEDKQYQENLLSYYTNVRKLASPMKNFSGFPKRYLAGCIKSISKRREDRLKLETEKLTPETTGTDYDQDAPF